MKVGICITCAVCGQQKKPWGRSAPLEMNMCEVGQCHGWLAEPKVGDLWPGETEEDFGYPCCSEGTKDIQPAPLEPEREEPALRADERMQPK